MMYSRKGMPPQRPRKPRREDPLIRPPTPLPGQDEIRTARQGGRIKRKKMHKMPDGSMMHGASHKGGKKKYGHGGKIDGCAVKGKTRGKMV